MRRQKEARPALARRGALADREGVDVTDGVASGSDAARRRTEERPADPVRRRFLCRLITEPPEGTRSVLVSSAPLEGWSGFFGGDGPVQQLCGSCRTVLMDGIEAGAVQDLVLSCPKCGMYNESSNPYPDPLQARAPGA